MEGMNSKTEWKKNGEKKPHLRVCLDLYAFLCPSLGFQLSLINDIVDESLISLLILSLILTHD